MKGGVLQGLGTFTTPRQIYSVIAYGCGHALREKFSRGMRWSNHVLDRTWRKRHSTFRCVPLHRSKMEFYSEARLYASQMPRSKLLFTRLPEEKVEGRTEKILSLKSESSAKLRRSSSVCYPFQIFNHGTKNCLPYFLVLSSIMPGIRAKLRNTGKLPKNIICLACKRRCTMETDLQRESSRWYEKGTESLTFLHILFR